MNILLQNTEKINKITNKCSRIFVFFGKGIDMKKYVFPAIISPEANGIYSVNFPDLEGCYTCGKDLDDALYMAEDVLAFTLYDYEVNKKEIPDPSQISDLCIKKGEFVNYINCDTLEYQKRGICPV